jgi:IS5 family transposase
MGPGKRKKLDKANCPFDAPMNKVKRRKASTRARVEQPLRVLRRQFGFARVRYPGLK